MSNVDVTPETTKTKRGRPKKQSQEIVPAEAAAMPAVEQAPSDTAALIAAITKLSRDTTINIDRMQYLLDTRRVLMNEEAEQAFADAMALAQAEMAPIARDCENPQTRSKYASYAALDRALRPIYTKHGFAIGFNTDIAQNPADLLVTCTVKRGRHKEHYSIPMPCDGKGPRGNDVMSRTHAVGSAVTYGRRYLLCCAFNIVSADDDGNRAGQRRAPPAYDPGTSHRRPPPADFVPAPPPPNDDERAAHTRQAIEAATANARSRLLQGQLEASVAATTPASSVTDKQLEELRALMKATVGIKHGENILCQHFCIENLRDLTAAQYEAAISRLKQRQPGQQ